MLLKQTDMNAVVIAGNGPSYLNIDYSRLPKDFDVFRCNQFYLENQYFLGKKIKGVFYNPEVFKQQYFTLYHLQKRGEYEVEDVYCNWSFKTDSSNKGDRIIDFNFSFPDVRNTYLYLEKLPQFLGRDRFFRVFYNRWPTSGIVMLITAIAQGYKEIYLTGIDFYMGGGGDYAFDVKNKKISKLLPALNLPDFDSPVHSAEIDRDFIELALRIKDIKLYAISPDSPICQIIPLAPVQRKNDPYQILPKPQGYIADLIDLPDISNTCTASSKLIEKVKRILVENEFYLMAKRNIFFIAVRDFLFCLRVLVVLIRNIGK